MVEGGGKEEEEERGRGFHTKLGIQCELHCRGFGFLTFCAKAFL